MRKAVFALICSSLIMTGALCGCRVTLGTNGNQSNTTQMIEEVRNNDDNEASDGALSDGGDAQSSNSSFDANAVANAIAVEGEDYKTEDSNYLVLKLTNKSEWDCNIELEIKLLDKKRNVLKTQNESIEAFAKGTTIAYVTNCKDAFRRYEYTIEVQYLSYYNCVDQNLKCEVSPDSGKAHISVTNNGEEAAQYVEYTALFYKDGELIYHDWGYANDDDNEIKPQKTVKAEALCEEDFDDVKVYLHGRSQAHFA